MTDIDAMLDAQRKDPRFRARREIEDKIMAITQWDPLEVSDSLLAPLSAVLHRHYEDDQKMDDIYWQIGKLQEALDKWQE